MTPIVAGGHRFGLFVAAVLPATGLLTAFLALAGGSPWLEAAFLSLPLVTI